VRYYITFLFIIFTLTSYSQNWLKVDSVFAVSGVTVKSFSAPAFADIDNNGTHDMFLGNITDVVDFFWNNSTDFPSTFSKDTSLLWNIYSGGLINTNSDYPALVDLDNDGDFDLVIGGYYGLLYYENVGTITEPEFVKNDTVFTNVNALIGGDPKPAFADLDGDGNYDLLVGIGESFVPGPDPGLTLGFRNIGTAELPIFELDATLVAGIPDVGLNSYPALADIDGDGDYDLLLGRDGGALYYYKNTGTINNPVWTREFTTFASVESSTYWKNPTFVDLDYDGDLDLVYGQSTGILYVYRNNGTPTNPLFQLYPDYFKVIKLDGSGGTASLADFDGDGDYDLISGMWDGKFYYFRNDGTNKKPVFNRVNMPFSSLTVNSYSSPVFVDIDGDGDYDIVSGALNGQVYCYINNNGSFTLDNSIFGFIDVGWMSIPTLADLDGDGDLDLLVGAEAGSEYRYYENTGSNVFIENTTMFSGIVFPGYSRPTLADVDNDGDYDLIIGRSNGAIIYYRNDGDASSPIWVRADSVFNGVKVKQNAHAGLADLDGDGRPDMVLAEYDGNFTFYKNLFAISSVQSDHNTLVSGFNLYQNYPNPFNPSTVINFHIPYIISSEGRDLRVQLKVFDVLGNEVANLLDEVKPAGYHSIEFNAAELSSGVYFYQLSATGGEGSFIETKKMIFLK
jgi:hypothetical protein